MREIVLRDVKEFIMMELLKRSINVDVHVDFFADKFSIKSSTFQTMPILFKRLEIVNILGHRTEQAYNTFIIKLSIKVVNFKNEISFIDVFDMFVKVNNDMSKVISISIE